MPGQKWLSASPNNQHYFPGKSHPKELRTFSTQVIVIPSWGLSPKLLNQTRFGAKNKIKFEPKSARDWLPSKTKLHGIAGGDPIIDTMQ